jgi:hypothetical protein
MAWFRRSPMPESLSAALGKDETALANAKLEGGGWLAVSRFGLWVAEDDGAIARYDWPLVSKARWSAPVLEVTVADIVGRIRSADRIADRAPRTFTLASNSKLTDEVHRRVRSGIVTADHHDLPGGGCWLVRRRVPGRDGVVLQVRLDPGTPEGAERFVEPLVAAAEAEFAE